MDLREDERLRRLYLDNERHDGYLRDRDVFTDGITIEDNLAVVVDYAGGPTLSYSLNAHSPWEGYRVAVNGTEGRAELEVVERGSAEEGAKVLDPSATTEFGDLGRVRPRGERLLVQRHWEQAREVPIVDFGGAHGGGDDMLLADIFGDPAAAGAGSAGPGRRLPGRHPLGCRRDRREPLPGNRSAGADRGPARLSLTEPVSTKKRPGD